MKTEKKYCYLDWNIIDKIQKLESLPPEEQEIYSAILNAISEGKIIVPYSNAHLSDIKRGHIKNPKFTKGNLLTLSRLTKNLCIAQYWKSTETILETRNVFEFFDSMSDDSIDMKSSFTEFIGDMSPAIRTVFNLYKYLPVPDGIIQAKEVSPIMREMFSAITPSSNFFDVMESYFAYMNGFRKDNEVYKSLKKNLNEGLKSFQSQNIDLSKFNESFGITKGSDVIDKVWEKQFEKSNTSANDEYNQVMRTYAKYNFKGHNADEKFVNMIDDSLHVFYAGHCHYFVSTDKKCRYKAVKTYDEMEITTQIFSPNEFYELCIKNFEQKSKAEN